jgi:mRNA interferase YafQ
LYQPTKPLTHCLADNYLEKHRLPEESKDHALNGEYSDCKEFHLGGESLVIYLIILKKEAILLRIGNHAQLFK